MTADNPQRLCHELRLPRYFAWLLAAAVLSVAAAAATAQSDRNPPRHSSYAKLADLLGDYMPTGEGVRVMQVEGMLTDRDERTFGWAPDADHPDFAGVRFVYAGPPSGHAGSVAREFFGRASMAPGVSEVECFPNVIWAHDPLGFLRSGTDELPRASAARVANHSWVGSSGESDLEVLKRVDYLVATDDFVQVAGANNAPQVRELLQCSFNAIIVGRSPGQHSTGTVDLGDETYTEGRAKPDIVAAGRFTSTAAPRVASAVAMLQEFAHRSGSALSRGSYRSPRTGRTIWHAESAVVLKAALMAGADREAARGYRGRARYRTDNGLDLRYGAGVLNVLNSYAILAGGEWTDEENRGDEPGAVPPAGFHYNAAFGGLEGTASEATYRMRAPEGARHLKVCLAWNVRINRDEARWDGGAELYDLDLKVYDLNHSARLPVAESLSWVDNTENLRIEVEPGHEYAIKVLRARGQEPFLWNYGLAWQFEGEDIVESIVRDSVRRLRVPDVTAVRALR